MKVREGFVLRDIGGRQAVFGIGPAASFGGIVRLNATGAFLWKALAEERTEAELIAMLCSHYDIDEGTARIDTEAFLKTIRDAGLIRG